MMANRAVKSCVEETCRRVMGNDVPFGGKTVILLGDFRQTGPIIPGGSRREIVDASIKSSPLWSQFRVFRLVRPIRNAEDIQFSEWVDSIGEGRITDVRLHDMFPIVTSADDLINFAFPPDILQDPVSCLNRAILAPTNQQINQYNDRILNQVVGEEKTFIAADHIKEADDSGIISPESVLDYVAHHTPPGLPDHRLKIKTNAVFRLLCNFSVDQQLVKNVRVVVTHVGMRLITVKIIREQLLSSLSSSSIFPIPEDILIPRISFSHQMHSGHTLFRQASGKSPKNLPALNSAYRYLTAILSILSNSQAELSQVC